MVLCAGSRHLLRSISASGARVFHRQSSGWVYSSSHGFDPDEIREKLLAFPGGAIDLHKQDSGVALLTVNNPSRMNSFTGGMMVDLEARVTELENWSEGKGLIVRGAAGTFCSGSDLNAVRAIANPQDGMKMCMFMQNTLTRLQRLPLISVALVEGRALGGGAELVTACDLVLMVEGSVVQFVQRHMGLVPGWGGAARLVRAVGPRNALKLLGGAVRVDPPLGLRMGLADEVLRDAGDEGQTVLRRAEEWLGGFTDGPPAVIRAAKQVTVSGRELPLEGALRTERDVFGTVWGGPANLQALAKKMKHK